MPNRATRTRNGKNIRRQNNSAGTAVPRHPDGAGPREVYREACRLAAESLEQYGITFRQVPFELKVD
jgi:hypothetical protein